MSTWKHDYSGNAGRCHVCGASRREGAVTLCEGPEARAALIDSRWAFRRDFIPTTGEVRDAYVRHMREVGVATASAHGEEFDRWVARLKETHKKFNPDAESLEDACLDEFEPPKGAGCADRSTGGLIAAGDRLPLRESMFCGPFPVSHDLDEIIAALAKERGLTKEQAIDRLVELWRELRGRQNND